MRCTWLYLEDQAHDLGYAGDDLLGPDLRREYIACWMRENHRFFAESGTRCELPESLALAQVR